MTTPGHQPEGGAADIRGHPHIHSGELRWPHGDPKPVHLYMSPHAAQHPLRVVPRGGGLADDGLALGIEPGDEEAGLELGAGHRHGVINAAQVSAADGQGRSGAVSSSHDLGAHLAQGAQNTLHGSGSKGTVPGDDAEEGLARQEARDQTHGGAAVARVQDLFGLGQASQALAVDDEPVLGLVAVLGRLMLDRSL